MKKFYFLFLSVLCTILSFAQNFTAGNLVVYRVGDGASALTNAATPVFLDEYTPLGVLVRSIPFPSTAIAPSSNFTASGTSTSEGMINRSADGRYLIFTGYDAVAGTADVSGTNASTVPRVIARTDYTGTTDISTRTTNALSNASIRSATSSNGTSFWLVGSNGGVRYQTFGTTTSTQIAGTPAGHRNINIYGGQLYTSSGSAGFTLNTVGLGLPTTSGQTVTPLPGIPTTASANQFVFFDLDASVPGVDVLYFADEVAGIQKYSLVGGTWVANGGVSNSGARGLTGTATGTAVTLYSTTSAGLYRIIDLGGYNVSPTSAINIPPIPNVPSVATLIASAPANTAFRGIAFAPTQFILPVTFSNLSVTKVAGRHQLNFTNDTESDIVRYEVERSADGRTFTTLQNILPLKNDGSQAGYLYNDGSPFSGLNVYRVKALELSGRTVYSTMVKVSDAKTGNPLVVFSNPAKGRAIQYQVNLQPGNYLVSVRSSTGQTVSQQSVSHSGGTISKTINLSHAASGVYYLEVNGPVRYTTSVVIE